MDDATMKNPEPTALAATAWRRIADDLTRTILAGDRAVGDALPTAQSLALHYGVNRHTVRQACKHLEEAGLVSIQQGRGMFVAGARLPYRLGRRVRFRENLRALDVQATSRILSSAVDRANAAQARALATSESEALWRIETLNGSPGQSLSLGVHWLSRKRFPDFPACLASHAASFTAAFRACGVTDYARLSTTIGARLVHAHESEALDLAREAVVLETFAVDGDLHGRPLQIVEAVFVADRVQFVLSPDDA